MNRVVAWIVGEPGIGKTTLTRKVLESYGPKTIEHPSPKWTIFGHVAGAGHWRGNVFDGADSLPISQIKTALPFFIGLPSDVAFLDGDKLANEYNVSLARRNGLRIVCFHLYGQELAAKRRAIRNTNQSETWVKGRRTKAYIFYREFPAAKFEFNMNESLDKAIKLIREICRS